jgi:cell division protein FtsB
MRPETLTRFVTSLGCVLLCATWGCTIAGQYEDIHATEDRITVKTQQLQQEEATQSQLQAEMKHLSDDLAEKQMTSAQLDARLAALQKQNQQLAAGNAKKRAQRDALTRELAGYRAQVAEIKASTPPAGVSSEAAQAAQQRQLDELKQRIHTRLLALAQGG